MGSITGLGTGVATALAVNVGTAGSVLVNGGALGTPSSGTLTNATGLPVSTGISGLGTGVATALAVNTGSAGAFVVNGGALGTPSSGTVTNLTGTASININGTVGATTPSTGAFTYLSTSSSTNTTPVLAYNASNCNLALGETVASTYLQAVMQNKSGTAGASTNFAVSNDLGTDSTYYGEFGMNSSVFSASTPVDFFSINNGVYFSAHDGDVTVGSGNGFKTYLAWGSAGQSAHVINASGAIGLNTNLGTTPALSGTTNFGTSGQVLTSAGSAATPTWTSLSGSAVTTFSAGTTGFTPSSATSGAVTLAGTLNIANGGTGQTTASAAFNALSPITTTGDLILGNGVNSATRLPIGANGYLLTSNGTTASWTAAPATGVTTFQTSLSGLTPSTASTGAVTLAGTLGATSGGTSQSTYTTGDMLYASASNTLSKLTVGTTGQILTVAGGVPTWAAAPASGVTTFSAGTTGFTPSTATSGAVTLAGTLATTNGGTGLTSFTSGGAVYATSTSALTTGTLPIASGGTNGTATPTSGGVSYGTGTAYAFTAAGTAGYVLTSNGSSAPTWAASAGATVTATSTNASFYPTFNSATSGSFTTANVNASFTYNPSKGELSAPETIASNGLVINSTTVGASYTIAAGQNAMSVGPMTVASGVAVTITSGQRWVVL